MHCMLLYVQRETAEVWKNNLIEEWNTGDENIDIVKELLIRSLRR